MEGGRERRYGGREGGRYKRREEEMEGGRKGDINAMIYNLQEFAIPGTSEMESPRLETWLKTPLE